MAIEIKYSDVVATVSFVIAIISLTISYRQSEYGREQLHLSGIQARPYIKNRPVFSYEKPDRLNVTLVSENLSPVPGKLIYDEVRIWTDGTMNETFSFSRGGDILYQHKGGASGLPPMPKNLVKRLTDGSSHLQIGTCVVYGPLAENDNRRWELRTLFAYEPFQDLPLVEYAEEATLTTETTRCDARTIRSEWLRTKEQPPHPEAKSSQ